MTKKLKMLQKYFKYVILLIEIILITEGVIQMMTKNKVLTSSLVILMAIGLAGCTNSAAAPTTNKSQAVSAKVAKKAVSTHSTQEQASSNNSSNINGTNNSSNTQVNSSQNTATSSTASSVATPQANSTSSTDDQNQQVLTSFVDQSNVQKDGNHYLVTPQSQDKYQIEVRNNQNGDPNVAHLTGIYQYNPTTQQIQTMDPVTGEFE